MSIHKGHALDRVAGLAQAYRQIVDESQEKMAAARRELAEAMVEAKTEAKATQQEIADATELLVGEGEGLTRQRVKQLIDDYREEKL